MCSKEIDVRKKLTQPLALQWHYRILQAMALDEDIPEKPDDKTIPKYKQIHKVREPSVIRSAYYYYF